MSEGDERGRGVAGRVRIVRPARMASNGPRKAQGRRTPHHGRRQDAPKDQCPMPSPRRTSPTPTAHMLPEARLFVQKGNPVKPPSVQRSALTRATACAPSRAQPACK